VVSGFLERREEKREKGEERGERRLLKGE